ncbi:MAG: DnaJ domain-containing protein [Planctomycetes bacterium]|nr:DnaJ domain-containing protein [Planctomycetota bacterium]
MARDYYEILGVARDATADQIRDAHRKHARKYHPDLNKSPDAAAMFKETQEAYAVLSDAEKRAKYDRFGHAGESHGPAGGPDMGGFGGADAETLESIFGSFMGGGRGRAKRARGPQPGEDLTSSIQVGFMTAALGGTHHVDLQGPSGPISMDVRIPAGITADGKLRLRGKGAAGSGGGPSGDLVLSVKIAPHPWFRRDELDIQLEVPISISEAALGAKVSVPLLQGSAEIRIEPGTPSGRKLRLKGKGIHCPQGTGDFFAVVRIEPPAALSPEDAEFMRQLGERLPSPRVGAPWSELKTT